MAFNDNNLAERSGNLVESHKNYDPRIILFYFILGALLLTLAAGLAFQQLRKVGDHANNERQQNQRRILIPGPRGNIYDRNGKILVGNDHSFAVLLHLDELKAELNREYFRIGKAYADSGNKNILNNAQLRQIARTTVAQRYLDQVNLILKRDQKVNVRELMRHFDAELLLPYPLIEGLEPVEYARLIEGLPVKSPLEVYASNVRSYPYGSAAAHTLGHVRFDKEVEAPDFPGNDLTTFRMKGTSSRSGLEKWFDAHLQGKAGGRIYRVDPAGYKINPPLNVRLPKQGKHLTSSLDIDLQLVAEEQLGDQTGAVVTLDVNTGEVLVLASTPSYDLNRFSPRATHEMVAEMNEKKSWVNLAVNGYFPPGSTFKILTSIAAIRSGLVRPDEPITTCEGVTYLGRRPFVCDNRRGHHGLVLLRDAIARSCDIYFYEAGKQITDLGIADEARRFRFDQRTGIELPFEERRMVVPDRVWKERERKDQGPWSLGDTYNTSIGQGFLLVSPLQMACFAASVARNEIWTQPTLVHRPNAPRQRHPAIGLTADQRSALVEGMEGTIKYGTASKKIGPNGPLHVEGVQLAGKTGTAQIPGNRNAAWFICFSPVQKPEIAIAVMVEGDVAGESLEGGMYAAPIAAAVLKKYYEKKNNPGRPIVSRLKTE